MAKNTRNTEFRKIDVDQYDEEKYKEEDQGETQSPTTGPSEGEVSTLLNSYPFYSKTGVLLVTV